MLALPALFPSQARGQVFSADAVKAAFLHRFASYIEWPPGAVGNGPFVIAVVGAEGVARNLDELLPSMTVQGRRAVVRRVTRVAELDGVHIVYFGPEMLSRARDLREAAMQRPVLLVTDGDAAFRAGGVVNFVESDNKVRFEVSLAAANRARLRIDSALLSVAARVVEGEPQAWTPWVDSLTSRYCKRGCPLTVVAMGRGR
ncbi:MAG TPA: YfiR family protein [Gammaproteobacteria bacterium]|nr:YfiR family protein [Gammaproteobacteria bacterium]